MRSEDGSDSLQIDTNAESSASVSDSSAPRKRSADGTKNNILSKKRIVTIDLEDDTNASVKGHGIDTSAEVVALQEKLKKLEKMFQGACRMTREAELRAEFAESIIDSKRGVKDNIENEKQKNEQLQKKLDEVSAQLEKERNRGEARAAADKKLEKDLYRENETLKREMANMSRIMESMNGCHNCSALPARIDDLTRELSESERKQRVANIAILDLNMRLKEKQAPKQSNADKKKAKAVANQNIRNYITSELATVTEKSDNLLDILLPCTTPGEYVDTSSAALFLRYDYHSKCQKDRINHKMQKKSAKCCGKYVGKSNIISHLGSKKHCREMRMRGGGVSKAALAHWIDVMEESKEKRIHETAEPAAAAQNNGGFFSWLLSWTKPVKEEIKEEELDENYPSHSTKQPNAISPSGLKTEIKLEECKEEY